MNLKLNDIRIGNILLREPILNDSIDLFQYGKANMCETLNWGPLKNLNEAKYIIETYIKRPEMEGIPKGYSIVYDNTMIGFIEFFNFNEFDKSAEIGCYLNPLYWNLGIMQKSIKGCINLLFNDFNREKIIMGHTIKNKRCESMILKLNFKYEYEKLFDLGNENYEIVKYYSLYKYERND